MLTTTVNCFTSLASVLHPMDDDIYIYSPKLKIKCQLFSIFLVLVEIGGEYWLNIQSLKRNMLLHLIPGLDSESIRMFKDGPLEKLRERGGEFSSRINLFSLLFSLYVFFLRLCINIFWGYLACIKFFPFNFPLVLRPLRLLWYFAPPPPPPRFHHNFSDNAKIMH